MKILAEYGGTRVVEAYPELQLHFLDDNQKWILIPPESGGQNELMVMVQDLAEKVEHLEPENAYLIQEVNFWREMNKTQPYPDKGKIL